MTTREVILIFTYFYFTAQHGGHAIILNFTAEYGANFKFVHV